MLIPLLPGFRRAPSRLLLRSLARPRGVGQLGKSAALPNSPFEKKYVPPGVHARQHCIMVDLRWAAHAQPNLRDSFSKGSHFFQELLD